MTNARSSSIGFWNATLLGFGCAFSNFTFFNVNEYPVNVALICVLLLLSIWFLFNFRLKPVAAVVALSLVGLLSLYAAFWTDQSEGIKSLGQMYLAIAFIYVVGQDL